MDVRRYGLRAVSAAILMVGVVWSCTVAIKAADSVSLVLLAEIPLAEDASDICIVALSPEGGFALLGSQQQRVVRFAQQDGLVLWDYPLPLEEQLESAAIATNGDMIVLGGQRGGVYALDRSGALLWRTDELEQDAGRRFEEQRVNLPPGTPLHSGCEIQVAVTDAGDRVYAAHQHALWCFDARGNVLWVAEPNTRGYVIWDISCTPDGTTLLMQTEGDILILDGTGHETAFYDVAAGEDLVASSLSPDGRRFAVSVWAEGGYVAMYDASEGELWRRELPAWTVSVDSQNNLLATAPLGNCIWDSSGVQLGCEAVGGYIGVCSREGTSWVVGYEGFARIYNVLLRTSALQPQTSSLMYSTTGTYGGSTPPNTFSPNTLISLDVQSSVQLAIGVAGETAEQGSIAWDPSSGFIFGVNYYNGPGVITRIDPTSGEATVAAVLPWRVHAISFSPTGQMYALIYGLDETGECTGEVDSPLHCTLVVLDPAQGTLTKVGVIGEGFDQVPSLDFSVEGELYAIFADWDSPSAVLVTVDPSTAAVKSSVNLQGDYSIEDIACAPDGYIYATNFSWVLIRIDPVTGSEEIAGFTTQLGSLHGVAAPPAE
jgi:hypothetical protein